MYRLILSLLALSVLGCSASTSTGEKGGVGDITGAYQIPDLKWPQWSHPYPRQGYVWGSQGGVFAESPNRILIANRGELKLPEHMPSRLFPGINQFTGDWGSTGFLAAGEPIANMANCIVVVDQDGKLIEAWNQWDPLFEFGRGPHSIYINPYDPERHVWVVDDIRNVIWKFSHDGKQLVQTLGVPGEFGDNEDLTRFRRPTAMDWLPDGTFFLSDGYGNRRVVKFDKDGKPLMKWGSPGKGPGQFGQPHGIAVSASTRRVYVSDRSNARIEVFDENGTFLEEWPGIAPHTLMMNADDKYLWALDSRTERLVQFDMDGHMVQAWGSFGARPGYIWCGHQMSADTDGNLYVAECFNGRTQKFRPKPGADPAKLVQARPLAGTS